MSGNQAVPGAFRSLTELHAAHNLLMERLEEHGDDLLPDLLLIEIDGFLERATKLGSRLNLASERADAQSVLTFWASVLLGAHHKPPTTILEAFDTTQAVQELGTRSPYKGLLSFEAEDAEFFFGRRELVAEMLRMLKSSRTLAV